MGFGLRAEFYLEPLQSQNKSSPINLVSLVLRQERAKERQKERREKEAITTTMSQTTFQVLQTMQAVTQTIGQILRQATTGEITRETIGTMTIGTRIVSKTKADRTQIEQRKMLTIRKTADRNGGLDDSWG